MNTIQRKKPAVAALLSLVLPGAGQMYNGQIGIGLLCMILTIGLYFTIVLGLILHIFVINDAYKYAKKLNKQMEQAEEEARRKEEERRRKKEEASKKELDGYLQSFSLPLLIQKIHDDTPESDKAKQTLEKILALTTDQNIKSQIQDALENMVKQKERKKEEQRNKELREQGLVYCDKCKGTVARQELRKEIEDFDDGWQRIEHSYCPKCGNDLTWK